MSLTELSFPGLTSAPSRIEDDLDEVGAPAVVGRVGDVVDRVAMEGFRVRYGRPCLGPVCIVIPAYQEEGNIGRVLAGIPRRVLSMRVSTVVVTDGCTDRTAQVARLAGAFVCEAAVNRGQGAAFRLGYAVAAAHGAQYVATLDADGQYDPDSLEDLLGPLLSEEADFVQGSRRMGSAEADDPVRTAGVYFFSVLISLLTGRRVTDSSNGFRVMKTAVVTTVRLKENQYQSSEMLIGAIRCGFRYVERPVAMRKRLSGKSKKACNFLYGLQYLRVVLTTRFRRRSFAPSAALTTRRQIRAAMAPLYSGDATAARGGPTAGRELAGTSSGRLASQ